MHAAALEGEDKYSEAIEAYISAARAGSADAAARLGKIYEFGLLGMKRDYAESLKWYNYARSVGAKGGWGCPPKC